MSKSKVKVSIDLLESLADSGNCWFDHHGGCQEHGYLSLSHGELCPQSELKEILTKHKESNDTAK